MELTTMEIAARCNKSERTVQRWIQKGTLKAQHIEGNRYEVDENDLARFLPHEVVDDLVDRLSALADRVSALEGLLAEMSNNPPIRRLTAPRATYAALEASESITLPDGYTPIVDLIHQHGAPETTVMRNMRPWLKVGPWHTSDGRVVRYALDAEGVAEFKRRYGR